MSDDDEYTRYVIEVTKVSPAPMIVQKIPARPGVFGTSSMITWYATGRKGRASRPCDKYLPDTRVAEYRSGNTISWFTYDGVQISDYRMEQED